MAARGIDPPVSVSVAPTTTVLATFDTTQTDVLTVQVYNTDAAQTLVCTVQRKATTTSEFVSTGIPDLSEVLPLTPACVDIPCEANSFIRIIGTASGAGLTATICGRDKPRPR